MENDFYFGRGKGCKFCDCLFFVFHLAYAKIEKHVQFMLHDRKTFFRDLSIKFLTWRHRSQIFVRLEDPFLPVKILDFNGAAEKITYQDLLNQIFFGKTYGSFN